MSKKTTKDYTRFTLDQALHTIKMMDGTQTIGWKLEYIPPDKDIPEHWRLTRDVYINALSPIQHQIQ